ncbi:MAG: GNAT family N-acetyltransferase [Desulfotomaculaceae bacterium]|nr:GNAT family N-acetyltransferase [Desulfotomaculaceae bacterium]
MNIRHATENDLTIIVDIYNSTVPSRMVTADTTPVTVESRLAWFREHNPNNRPIWIAEDRGNTLGWLSFSSFYNRPAYYSTAEVSIYIAEEHRGKGIGKKLLEKAIHESPTLGITTILGFIFGHNEPSLQLFQKFNFEQWGFLPKVAVLDGKEKDLVILGLRVV